MAHLENPERRHSTYLVLKRTLDIVFSLIFLVFIAPTLLLIALAIKLESSGPVFFRNVRVGKKGRLFTGLKFRTMYVSASRESIDPTPKITQDPRVTRVGRFLRKTGLDEVPILWNVLRGDLSIVGPRPPFPYEAQRYTPDQARRLECTPGITGYWQVYGRQEGRFNLHDMVQMDLEYAARRSLLLDFKIIVDSFLMSLRGRQSY